MKKGLIRIIVVGCLLATAGCGGGGGGASQPAVGLTTAGALKQGDYIVGADFTMKIPVGAQLATMNPYSSVTGIWGGGTHRPLFARYSAPTATDDGKVRVRFVNISTTSGVALSKISVNAVTGHVMPAASAFSVSNVAFSIYSGAAAGGGFVTTTRISFAPPVLQ